MAERRILLTGFEPWADHDWNPAQRLAERLEYGLKKAYANGEHDRLINRYFGDSMKLLKTRRLKLLHVPNTNIDKSFFERDRPYLMESVVELEKAARR